MVDPLSVVFCGTRFRRSDRLACRSAVPFPVRGVDGDDFCCRQSRIDPLFDHRARLCGSNRADPALCGDCRTLLPVSQKVDSVSASRLRIPCRTGAADFGSVAVSAVPCPLRCGIAPGTERVAASASAGGQLYGSRRNSAFLASISLSGFQSGTEFRNGDCRSFAVFPGFSVSRVGSGLRLAEIRRSAFSADRSDRSAVCRDCKTAFAAWTFICPAVSVCRVPCLRLPVRRGCIWLPFRLPR